MAKERQKMFWRLLSMCNDYLIWYCKLEKEIKREFYDSNGISYN